MNSTLWFFRSNLLLLGLALGFQAIAFAGDAPEGLEPVQLTDRERAELLEFTSKTRMLIERAFEGSNELSYEEVEISFREVAERALSTSEKSEPRLELLSRIAIRQALDLTGPLGPIGQSMGRGLSGYVLQQSLVLALEYLPREAQLLNDASQGEVVQLPVFEFAAKRFVHCAGWASLAPEEKIQVDARKSCASRFIATMERARPGDRKAIGATYVEIVDSASLPILEYNSRFTDWVKVIGAHAGGRARSNVIVKKNTNPTIESIQTQGIPNQLRLGVNLMGGSADDGRASNFVAGARVDVSYQLTFDQVRNDSMTHGAQASGLFVGNRDTSAQVGLDDLWLGNGFRLGRSNVLQLQLGAFSASYFRDSRLGVERSIIQALVIPAVQWDLNDRQGQNHLSVHARARVGLIGISTVSTLDLKDQDGKQVVLGGATAANVTPRLEAEVAYRRSFSETSDSSLGVRDRFDFLLNHPLNSPGASIRQLENHATVELHVSPATIRVGHLWRNLSMRSSMELPPGFTGAPVVNEHYFTFGAELK